MVGEGWFEVRRVVRFFRFVMMVRWVEVIGLGGMRSFLFINLFCFFLVCVRRLFRGYFRVR